MGSKQLSTNFLKDNLQPDMDYQWIGRGRWIYVFSDAGQFEKGR